MEIKPCFPKFMKLQIPTISGTIARRFLINFRIDPESAQKIIPRPFYPKLYKGYAIGGICLIKLENIRPKLFPFGINSENAAHRFAVEWVDEKGAKRSGVYVLRRDSNSLLNHLAGGKIFPGIHHRARFSVSEDQDSYNFQMNSFDETVKVTFQGKVNDSLPKDSCFPSIKDSSAFFEDGSLGYSPGSSQNKYEGLFLKVNRWEVKPFAIEKVYSSFFSDESIFPKSSISFDHALIIKNIPHEWHYENAINLSGQSNG